MAQDGVPLEGSRDQTCPVVCVPGLGPGVALPALNKNVYAPGERGKIAVQSRPTHGNTHCGDPSFHGSESFKTNKASL